MLFDRVRTRIVFLNLGVAYMFILFYFISYTYEYWDVSCGGVQKYNS